MGWSLVLAQHRRHVMLRVTPPQIKGDVKPVEDEAGTAPEDRPFRPDVEGLRAVAVVLVVLYHAGVSQLSAATSGSTYFS